MKTARYFDERGATWIPLTGRYSLRRSDPGGPGLRCQRCGRGFRYLGPGDQPIRDAETLARIKALVIPPAVVRLLIRHG